MGLYGFGRGYERAQREYDRALPAEGGEPCYGCCAGCGEEIQPGDRIWRLGGKSYCAGCVERAAEVAS